MAQTGQFSLKFYFHTITRMLGEPRKFFSELSTEIGWKPPLGVLLISSIFFAGASLLNASYYNPLLMGGVFFINAVGMAFIMAGFAYMVMVMTMGKRVTFKGLFSIYAFSSGTTLLASWIFSFLIFTEPWKWWLIWTGMRNCCGFTKKETLMIISLSIGMLFVFLYSLAPLFLSKV